MGQKFVDKIKHMKQLKQNEIQHIGNGEIETNDPKIHYFMQCAEDQDLVLPIIDKVCKKTLVLQEYTLRPGQCRGLAKACQYFHHTFINRVFFNNSGIDDAEFADILGGLSHLKDFKSIIYKANQFSDLSINALGPILRKRLPHQLTELKLIDCPIGGTHLCKLLDLLMLTDSKLSTLTLVNVGQTENSFVKTIEFLERS